MSLTVNAFFCVIIIIFLTFILWFGRYYVGKFLDNISPFPFLREGGKYKYTNFAEDMTYQGQILWIDFSVFIACISILLSFGLNWIGWVFALPALFPALMLLLRIRTFSDDSILPETGIGYDASKAWRLSMIGSLGLAVVFFVLNVSDNLILPIITLVLILLGGLIPIFPDYINKYLSYDIRSERGELFLEKITWTFMGISWVFLLVSSVVLL